MKTQWSPQVMLGIGIGAALLLGLLFYKSAQTVPPAAHNNEMMNETIKTYIDQHPEDILQAVEKYQERKTNEMIAQLTANIKSKKNELEQNAADPKLGSDAASVKIVEFFDYGCVYCRKMQPLIAKAVQNNPDVQIVFKEMPMFGDASTTAAKIALAVNKIDSSKYYQFYSSMMHNQNNNLAEAAMEIATGLGISADKIKQVMQDASIEKTLADNRKLATEIGVRGAPAFVINGELFIGLIEPDLLQAKLDAAKGLKSTESTPPAVAQPTPPDNTTSGQAADQTAETSKTPSDSSSTTTAQ